MTIENRGTANNECQVRLNSIKQRVQQRVGGIWTGGRWTKFIEEVARYLHASCWEEIDIIDSLVGLITHGIQSENNLIAIADCRKEFREALSTRKEIVLPAICDVLYHKYVVAARQQQDVELSFAHLPTHSVSSASIKEHASQDPPLNNLHNCTLSENATCQSMAPPISKGESEVDAVDDKMSSPPPLSSSARNTSNPIVIEIGHLLARKNNLHNTKASTQEESMIATSSPMKPLHVDCVPVLRTDQTKASGKSNLDVAEDPEYNSDHTYLGMLIPPTTRLSFGGTSVAHDNRNTGNTDEARSIMGSLFQQGNTGGGLLNERCNVGDEAIPLIPRTLPGSQKNRFDKNLILAPADYDGGMMYDNIENGAGFELADDHEPREGFGTVEKEPHEVKEAQKVETKKSDPWALVDPHDMRPTKAQPLRIGVTYRLPEGLNEPPSKAITEAHTRLRESIDQAAPSVVSIATENFRAIDANLYPQQVNSSQALGTDISKNTSHSSDSFEAAVSFDTEDVTVAESRKSVQQSINLRTSVALVMEYPIKFFLRNADVIPHNDDTVSTDSRQQQSIISQPAWNAASVTHHVRMNERTRPTRDEAHTDFSPRQKMKRTKIESYRGRVLPWMSQTTESTGIGMDMTHMAAGSVSSFPLPHNSTTSYYPQASHPLHGRRSHYDSGPLPCYDPTPLVLYPSTFHRHTGPIAPPADFSARQNMELVWPPAYRSELARRATRAAPPNDCGGMHAPYVPTFSQPRVLPMSTSHDYHHPRHGGYKQPHCEHGQWFASLSFLRNADVIPHNDDTVSTDSRQQQSIISQPAWNAASVTHHVRMNERTRPTRDEAHTDFSPRQKMKRTKIESYRGRVLPRMSQTTESTGMGMDFTHMAAGSVSSFPLPHNSTTSYYPQASHPLHGRRSHHDSGPLPCYDPTPLVLYPSTFHRHTGPIAPPADFSARQNMEQVWPPAYHSELSRRATRAAQPNDCGGMHAPYVPTFSQPRVLPMSTSHDYHHPRHGGYKQPHCEYGQWFASLSAQDHTPMAPSPHHHYHHHDAREHGVATHSKVSSTRRCVPLDKTTCRIA